MLFPQTSGEMSPSFMKANRAAQSWKYTLSCHDSTRASALIKKWKMWHDQPSISATHPQPRSPLLLVLMNHCSHADFRWPKFFFFFFSFSLFFCALSHAPTHSSLRSLESGADLKWSGWTPLSPRKTKQYVRIPKPAGDVRKTSKWGNKSPFQSTHLRV